MLLQESSDTTLFRLRNRELADTVEVAIPSALENTKQFGKRVVRTELGDRTID